MPSSCLENYCMPAIHTLAFCTATSLLLQVMPLKTLLARGRVSKSKDKFERRQRLSTPAVWIINGIADIEGASAASL